MLANMENTLKTVINSSGPFKHLTIVGAGLIGGSVAMAAKNAFPGLRVLAVDTQEETLQYALRHGIADDVSLKLPVQWPVQWEDGSLIVLATHLSAARDILAQLPPIVTGRDIIITDVGSCKRRIAELGQSLLPDQFIAGHPMAGREFSGIHNATDLLFAGKSWLFCPPPGVDPARFERLKAFVTAFRAIPRTLDADSHDRAMAYVSHLPQLYSILLTNLIDAHQPGRLLSYHGGGIDDQLRLAASPYAMWGEVLAENADNLRDVLAELGGMMTEVAPLLDEPEAMAQWFERSNRLHRDFNALKTPTAR